MKLLLHTVILVAELTWAAPKTADQLLGSATRPTMQEFLAAHDPLPAQNPYPFIDYTAVGSSQLEAFKNDFAKIIVQLEYAFPGATFYGLGRDSAALVEAMDAFYLSFGQKGRARRLDASGGSFVGATDETILLWLKSSGIDVSNIMTGPPAVIFDGTRFTANSQSVRIMRTIYSALGARHSDLKKALHKVNFVSTAFDGYAYYPRNNIADISLAQFWKEREANVTALGPDEILSVSAWYLTHGHEWHAPFSAIWTERGSAFAPPGALSNRQTRSAVMGMMYELAKLVRSSPFLEQIRTHESLRGIQIGLPALGAPAPAPVRKQQAQSRIEISLGILPDDPEYIDRDGLRLTENGWQVLKYYHENLPNSDDAQGELIAFILKARTSNRLGDRDARNLIRRGMSMRLSAESKLALAKHLIRHPGDLAYLNKKVVGDKEYMEILFSDLDEVKKFINCAKAAG